ncbi:hypothetical protein PTTG_27035 [Puccinia triticina 1-1 BBBD Race 1]|uniref:Chromo domain-containing protein n=1 Tax=Puccinia triticina (isolate 1-1 / race 1 (BBBD)) TaxID=630390 RepID=A0A180GNB5_PUCT1|nr:hypothetical protein PTTG_27035 [Puccinia triticina 1-1 BBBD Race 1]
MECLVLARNKQAAYYNVKKKPAPVYSEGEMVLLLLKRMVGTNAVDVLDRGVVDGIKDKYYKDEEVVDWSLMKAILDVRSQKKGKFEFLISWKGATVANNTWVAEEHIPLLVKSSLDSFKLLNEKHFGAKRKRRSKKAKKAAEGLQVQGQANL